MLDPICERAGEWLARLIPKAPDDGGSIWDRWLRKNKDNGDGGSNGGANKNNGEGDGASGGDTTGDPETGGTGGDGVIGTVEGGDEAIAVVETVAEDALIVAIL